MKALVLLSGGLDSAVVLAKMLERGRCESVGFDYGQPHRIELAYAERLAGHYGVPFRIVGLPNLPRTDDVVFAGRNLLLAAHGIAIAASEGFDAIALGCNFSDWDRFPDCRPAFWKGVNAASAAYGVHVQMPLLQMSKAQVVAEAEELGVPIGSTWSCYQPRGGDPCGECLACRTRAEAGA